MRRFGRTSLRRCRERGWTWGRLRCWQAWWRFSRLWLARRRTFSETSAGRNEKTSEQTKYIQDPPLQEPNPQGWGTRRKKTESKSSWRIRAFHPPVQLAPEDTVKAIEISRICCASSEFERL